MTILFLLASLILAAVILFACATSLLFWYEAANGSAAKELTRISNGHPHRWMLFGFLSAIGSQLITIFSYPAGFFASLWLPRRTHAPRKPTVVFIHGIYHNPSAWLTMSKRFADSGFDNQYALRYSSITKDFDTLAQRISRDLKNLLDNTAVHEIILVGHSLGGLFIRNAMKDPDIRAKVCAAVTLGTPHNGSKLAAISFGKLGKSITLGGPALRTIEKDESAPACPCLALSSPVDSMVLPSDSLTPSQLKGWEHQLCGPVSHVGMLHSRKVADMATSFCNGITEAEQHADDTTSGNPPASAQA